MGDKAHLEIKLIELTRRAVGARILVAETRRDLEVFVVARDHEQLLELLRRLGQRIVLAGVQSRGHQEIARALGAACRQDRRLHFHEALVDHAATHAGDDVRAQLHRALHLLAPQVQIAVGQAKVFVDVLVAVDLEGHLLTLSLYNDFVDVQFDLAG